MTSVPTECTHKNSMTLSVRLIESFKSSEFDIDYFVHEASRSSNPRSVLSQLDQSLIHIERDLRTAVTESSEIVLSASSNSDHVMGELLSVREHLSRVKQVIERLANDDRQRLDKAKGMHLQLQKAIEISKLLKRISKVSTDVSKLRAQFPTELSLDSRSPELVNKACLLLGQIESVRNFSEFRDIAGVELIQDDLAWLERLIDAFRVGSTSKLAASLTASQASKDLVTISKCIQVLFNLGCLREEAAGAVDLLVSVFTEQFLIFAQRIPNV